ncbi:MAG: Gfo/Idh/MocA family oxidoreductase [Muribaculaceae bacterium]|nr:Gfo/Idh/MocA family oxidoreductase [Muribaculaceae bacterium]
MKAAAHIMALTAIALATACGSADKSATTTPKHKLAVVDPGHFHAALVTKSPLEALSDTIRLFAPEGAEVRQYLDFIAGYNGRSDNPTCWIVDSCITPDFLDSLKADVEADIVVLAGNNRHKTDYILEAIRAGKNVLADKPMAIDGAGFEKLAEAYRLADEKGLVIRELMTERYDTINIFTRRMLNSGYIGTPISDSVIPAVEMTSVHHFFKEVSGSPLRRPEWYYDVAQQGEGIADVTTHLIDLLMWQCFPEETVDWQKDIEIIDATHTPTVITPEQYYLSTGATIDEPISVYANGNILARIKGMLVSLNVRWDFEAPVGGGDTFSAIYRYSDGQLHVIQDKTTGYIKDIFIYKDDEIQSSQDEFIRIVIPDSARTGHEEHFNRVTDAFLRSLDGEPAPSWEAANTLAKYRLTTEAVDRARSK